MLAPDGTEPDYLALEQSLDLNTIQITELDKAGSVPELRLKNSGEKSVLIIEGEELVGAKQKRGEIRTFVLYRIKMLWMADEEFSVPQDFVFEKFIRHSFKVMQDELYTVRIRISPSWAKYVGEKIWHESQGIQKLFDGGIEINFRVAGLDEIKQWVLSLGSEAYVMEPEELKDLVESGLRNALAQYDESVQPQEITFEEKRSEN